MIEVPPGSTWAPTQGVLRPDYAAWQAALLGEEGTIWAEAVSKLLVAMLKACHVEAAQVWGFWRG